MRELSGRMVALDDLADREIAVLRRRLEDATDWNARLDLAEAFVLDGCGGALRSVRRSPRPIASSPSAMAMSASRRSPRRLDWSRKHLSQRFQEEIGLPPKAVARIFRFNRLLDLARLGKIDRTGPASPPNAAMPTRRI